MTAYALIVLASFTITGFDDIKACTDARETVLRQMQKPTTSSDIICVPVPDKGQILGRGSRSTILEVK